MDEEVAAIADKSSTDQLAGNTDAFSNGKNDEGNRVRQGVKETGLNRPDSGPGPASKVEHLRALAAEPSCRPSDRLFAILLQQILPGDDQNGSAHLSDPRSSKYIDRPAFSIPLMSNNFRRFNARIGVVFAFQYRMIRLFAWRVPSQTLSFLAIYSFLCLEPSLLAVLPIVFCLFFVMVPAFVARHVPASSGTPADLYDYALHGPPLAPPPRLKPAPEFSKDFFRNMRDLQNSMDDFSRLHDSVIDILNPLTNFSNEALSSAIFLFLSFLACFLFLVSDMLPWRALALAAGWIATFACHPSFQEKARGARADEFIRSREKQAKSGMTRFVADDVILSSAAEAREVEIFELQHRDMHGSFGAEFESFLFSPSPYTPLSPSRVAGDRPHGTRFFEDVQPPKGWRWREKKWTLDLSSREWVEDRCITGVEVEVEGERWVTDIVYDEDQAFRQPVLESGKDKSREDDVGRQWEKMPQPGRRGEWRRRRWFRLVERRVTGANAHES